MPLRVLMLRRQQADVQQRLDAQTQLRDVFAAREAELEAAIAEANTEEERAAVEEAVTAFEAEQRDNAAAIIAAEEELRGITEQITALEAEAAAARSAAAQSPPDSGAAPSAAERSDPMPYNVRAEMFGATPAERAALIGREDVKTFLTNIRGMSRAQTRAVTGADLLVPAVLLDVLRENINRYSRLIGFVRLRSVRGTARQNIAGEIPEAVWTDCRAVLNELDISFSQIEVNANKVGGYVVIPNCDLYDGNDVGLAAMILDSLGQAIGLALDKAIVYGNGDHMPIGFVTRIAATEQPTWWGAHQAAFTDLHSSNVLTLNLSAATGTQFFMPLLSALGVPKGGYSQTGNLVWIMNHRTHMDILSRALAFNAAGALVGGVNDTMPVVGGRIIEEDRFMADYQIAGGYLDCQLMVEREGTYLAASEHARFIEDQVVFKGTARWDGAPLYGEAFVIVSYNNDAPTTSVSFAQDYANDTLGTLIVTSAQGSTSGKTAITVTGNTGTNLKYALTNVSVTYGDKINGSAWADYTAGTDITAATGTVLTMVELDADGRAIKSGFCIVTAKA